MAEAGADKRAAWLGTRVCSTLKLKDDAWKAIMSGDSKCDPHMMEFGSQ